jgi:hypothetical protein
LQNFRRIKVLGIRGRKSAAELTTLRVISVRRPNPPGGLTEAEASIWRETVGSMPAGWFSKAQFPVLVAYCRHTARAAMLAAQVEKFQPEWIGVEGGLARLDRLLAMAERESRSVLACARTMRLTHQSQRSPSVAGTAMRSIPQGPRPWDDD